METRIISTLMILAFSAPLYIAWLVGLILAIVNWKKIPKPSLLTIIAIVSLFLFSVAYGIFSMNYPISAYEKGISSTQISNVVQVVNFINNLLTAACLGLILAAIFGRRNPAV